MNARIGLLPLRLHISQRRRCFCAFVSSTVLMLETQTGHVLKRLRTDSGREDDNTQFAQWLASQGAVWKPMSRESPQQNAGERLP